jgi:endonuclease-3
MGCTNKSVKGPTLPEVDPIIRKLKETYLDISSEPSAKNPFMTLIGCILSQRTRDNNAEKASASLFEKASTPDEILRLGEAELEALIRSSGFYRQKAHHISGVCRVLAEEHGGAVPRDREKLLKLPGVGPKTADIVLAYSYETKVVPVDVHVWRVSRRLGLADMDADHEEVKTILEEIIPDEDKILYDRAVLKLGKDYCRKTRPRCPECPLKSLCGYANRVRSAP